MDKDRLKAEIERIENIKRNKASKFIHEELNQYLKLLKKQLKQAKKMINIIADLIIAYTFIYLIWADDPQKRRGK